MVLLVVDCLENVDLRNAESIVDPEEVNRSPPLLVQMCSDGLEPKEW